MAWEYSEIVVVIQENNHIFLGRNTTEISKTYQLYKCFNTTLHYLYRNFLNFYYQCMDRKVSGTDGGRGEVEKGGGPFRMGERRRRAGTPWGGGERVGQGH
jgi:hypothetical protein